MGEKKQSENVKDEKSATKGVMISVYVESPTTRSHKQSNSNSIKRLRKQVASESRGYDRRAHLLAYARHLRNTESQSDVVQLPPKQQSRHHQPKENCLWFQLCCSPTSGKLGRSNSQWRYDRMPLNEKKELKASRKKKSNVKTTSPILRKLKSILKEMSCKKIKL